MRPYDLCALSMEKAIVACKTRPMSMIAEKTSITARSPGRRANATITDTTNATCAKNVAIAAYWLPDWRSFCARYAIGPVAAPYAHSIVGMTELLSARLAKYSVTRMHQAIKTA